MYQGKDNHDARPHGANNSSTRRSRNGADRHLGRGASTAYSGSATYSASGMAASILLD